MITVHAALPLTSKVEAVCGAKHVRMVEPGYYSMITCQDCEKGLVTLKQAVKEILEEMGAGGHPLIMKAAAAYLQGDRA